MGVLSCAEIVNDRMTDSIAVMILFIFLYIA